MTWFFILFDVDLNQRFGREADEIGGSVERNCAQVLAPSTIERKSPQGRYPSIPAKKSQVLLSSFFHVIFIFFYPHN
jgi:hypothetical protein